ncbi:pyridoxal phosphate phosphatase PHOSPHO2 isoform X3 [Haemorhous mexicanus]|uniref:pyridoxal phosphate phosphatase PHOSPHO2 isoform X3 n=1 Tax=Haemorhous mexicanus TaxID=30427 RepID=UPI0028BD4DAC|nr:pyridoxal phosphate phosphatase PHOSPHO2 isoform X3 [Haemorhous mexicanus]
MKRRRAPPSPAPGSCGRAAAGPSHTEGGERRGGSHPPASPGGRTLLRSRFLNISFPCGASVPGVDSLTRSKGALMRLRPAGRTLPNPSFFPSCCPWRLLDLRCVQMKIVTPGL